MKLRNTERYLELIDFDPLKGEISRVLTKKEEKHKSNGFFCDVEKKIFGLGVSSNDLWVIVEGAAHLAEAITITCLPSGEGKEFCVYKQKVLLCSLKYIPNKPHWNFFYMEDEDVDSLLLISNILKSSQRKRIFIGANSG